MTEEEMMASEIDIGLSEDDIEAPVLLPEGWYKFEVVTPAPSIQPNAKKKADPSDPEAADNYAAHLKTIHLDPMFDGRRLPVWLPLPKEGDNEKFTNKGQRVSHAKAERIINFADSFQGSVNGKKVKVDVGGIGMAYVLQRVNQTTKEPENQIDPFGKFKKVETDLSLGDSLAAGLDDAFG